MHMYMHTDRHTHCTRPDMHEFTDKLLVYGCDCAYCIEICRSIISINMIICMCVCMDVIENTYIHWLLCVMTFLFRSTLSFVSLCQQVKMARERIMQLSKAIGQHDHPSIDVELQPGKIDNYVPYVLNTIIYNYVVCNKDGDVYSYYVCHIINRLVVQIHSKWGVGQKRWTNPKRPRNQRTTLIAILVAICPIYPKKTFMGFPNFDITMFGFLIEFPAARLDRGLRASLQVGRLGTCTQIYHGWSLKFGDIW